MRETNKDNLKCPYCGAVAKSYDDKIEHIEMNHLFRLKD